MSEETQDVVDKISTDQFNESADDYSISLLAYSPGVDDIIVAETSHSNRQHTGGSIN